MNRNNAKVKKKEYPVPPRPPVPLNAVNTQYPCDENFNTSTRDPRELRRKRSIDQISAPSSSSTLSSSSPSVDHSFVLDDASSYSSDVTSKESQSQTQTSVGPDSSDPHLKYKVAKTGDRKIKGETRTSSCAYSSSIEVGSSTSNTMRPPSFIESNVPISRSLVSVDSGLTPTMSVQGSSPINSIDFTLETVPEDVHDIDAIDPKNKLYDPRYARSIFYHRKQAESKYLLKSSENIFFKPRAPNCIQQDITERMRSVLIDWMIDISFSEFRLLPATVFLGVQLLDRLIGSNSVRRSKFQLLGCACLLVASKFEEVLPLSLEALVVASDHCFDSGSLVLMEKWCFECLHYDVNTPTRHYFLTRFALAANLTEREDKLAHYLLELTLQDIAFRKFPASAVAAAALHLTIQMMREKSLPIWTPTIAFYTECNEVDLFQLVLHIREIHWYIDSSDFKASIRKYDRADMLSVSQCPAMRFKDLRFDDARIDLTYYHSLSSNENGVGPASHKSKLLTNNELIFN